MLGTCRLDLSPPQRHTCFGPRGSHGAQRDNGKCPKVTRGREIGGGARRRWMKKTVEFWARLDKGEKEIEYSCFGFQIGKQRKHDLRLLSAAPFVAFVEDNWKGH